MESAAINAVTANISTATTATYTNPLLMRAPKSNKPTVVPIETTATIMLGMWNHQEELGNPSNDTLKGPRPPTPSVWLLQWSSIACVTASMSRRMVRAKR